MTTLDFGDGSNDGDGWGTDNGCGDGSGFSDGDGWGNGCGSGV